VAKILWISDWSGLKTGMGRTSYEVLSFLSSTGKYDIHELGWFLDKPHDNGKWDEIPCPAAMCRLPNGNIKKDAYGEYLFDEVVDKINPDIVITFGDVWAVKYIAKSKHRDKFKWVQYITIDGVPLHPVWIDTIRAADRVICCSLHGVNAIKDSGVDIKADCVYLGSDPNIFKPVCDDDKKQYRENIGISPDDFLIGFFGRNQNRKGLEHLISAFGKGKKSLKWGEKIKLFIVSNLNDGFGVDIQLACKRLVKSENSVIFYEKSTNKPVDDTTLNMLYNISDVAVFPSQSEGFGLQILECMQAGTPCISTKYSVPVELLKDGRGVLTRVVQKTDGEPLYLMDARFMSGCAIIDDWSLANDIDNLIKHKKVRESVSQKALKFSQKYTWQETGIGVSKVLDEVAIK